jgi:hypothetical protein
VLAVPSARKRQRRESVGWVKGSDGSTLCAGNAGRRWSDSATLFRHLEGIAAYCDHHVRFGVVESINTTIKAVLRRGRRMRDEEMLLLKPNGRPLTLFVCSTD